MSDLVLVWQIDPAEAVAARNAGLIDCELWEYQDRIADMKARCKRDGLNLVKVPATVGEILRALDQCHEQKNITEAIMLVYMSKQANRDETH